jgi:hypothetical protein
MGEVISLRFAIVATVLAATPSAALAAKGVPNALLAQAARTTPVKDIDYGEDRCDSRTVEQWLTALAGPQAKSIAWTGGACQIVGPGIDSGSRWCAQATITLAQPMSRDDRPMVEVFFETPVNGRPGPAYAFRGAMRAIDGDDTMRFRKDFESIWTSRFPAPPGAVVDCPAEEEP